MHKARRIQVEHLMGTVISIDVRDAQVPQSAIDGAFAWLHEVDRRFSPFKAGSEISRLGRGEVTIDECHPDIATVLDLCEALRVRSGGAFNAWRARRDGRLDPSGVVKGWSVERAAEMLSVAGARNFAINAGGDVLVRGRPEPDHCWRIGLRHPDHAGAVSAIIEVSDLAVATSGSYERGRHILDARSGEAPGGLVSLTVVGPSMTLADANATAGFAMGLEGIAWVGAQPGYRAYGVTEKGIAVYDDRFAELLTRRESIESISATTASAPSRRQP